MSTREQEIRNSLERMGYDVIKIHKKIDETFWRVNIIKASHKGD